MSISAVIPDDFTFDKGYNCFCSPVGVLLKLFAVPYANSALYQRWDFFYKNGGTGFGDLIQKLYLSTQKGIKENLFRFYGLVMHRRTEDDGEKALDLLKQCLNQNQPVMVTLDLHYLPYLPFSERRFHNIHFLIITGYDPGSNQVSVIDSFAGYRGELDLDALCKARQSDLHGLSIQNCWYEFTPTGHAEIPIEERMRDLLANCKQNLNAWKSGADPTNGIGALKTFAGDIQHCMNNDRPSQWTRVAEYIRDIEWQRKGFATFLNEIVPFIAQCDTKDLNTGMREISEGWTQLRRSFYMDLFRKKPHLNALQERLLEQARKEERFISILTESFQI